jgi:hypothetical protein
MAVKERNADRLLGVHGDLGRCQFEKNTCASFPPTPNTPHVSWVATKKCYNLRRRQFQFAGNREGVFPYLGPMALGKNNLATANGSPHNPSAKGDAERE